MRTRPTTLTAMAVLAALSVLATACSVHRAAEPHSRGSTFPPQVEGRPWDPLRDAIPGASLPRAVPAPPTQADLRSAAAASGTRAGAEQYAVVVTNALTDVRPGLTGDQVLSVVAAPDLPAIDRASTLSDLETMDRVGWQRRFDPTVEMWIRSRPTGPVGAPERVVVEIAGYLDLGAHQHGTWEITQLGVVRYAGVWKVDSITGGGRSITGARHVTPEENPDVLPGAGWRRIPPSSG